VGDAITEAPVFVFNVAAGAQVNPEAPGFEAVNVMDWPLQIVATDGMVLIDVTH
jgi:hypothetical protein